MIIWKEVSAYTGREIEEDAPVNSVAGGGVSMPPDAVHAKKKKKHILFFINSSSTLKNYSTKCQA